MLQRKYLLGVSDHHNPLGVGRFKAHSGTRKIAEKTQERLKKLIWLAAQAVKAELFGGEGYEYSGAGITGGSNNQKLVQNIYWSLGCNETHFHRLDSEALLFVMRTRSEQSGIFKAKYCKSRLKGIYLMQI